MRLLLVEPDRIMARSVTRFLTRHDAHEVRWVTSGQAAVDALEEATPDMIILEPQLGLHNGIEFLYELRSYQEWFTLPVMLWTINRALLAPAFEQPLRRLGVQAVLYKPQASLAQLERSLKTSGAVATS